MKPLDKLLARVGIDRASLNPHSKLARALSRGAVPRSDELERILAIPSYRWQDDPDLGGIGLYLEREFALPVRSKCKPRCGHKEYQRQCKECVRAHEACACRGEGVMHLRPVQVAMLQAIHDHGGLLANVRVGGGKTLVSYLASVVTGASRPMLLIPANLRKKTSRDFSILKRHWRGPDTVHLMSYELLARDRGIAELHAYLPDLIIADEAYSLKNLRAACTDRLHKYLVKHDECAYVDMSGTMTKRSLMDYHHRMLWALDDGVQPLPRKREQAQQWADALDEKISSGGRLSPGALLELCTENERQQIVDNGTKEGALAIVRGAYSRRLMSAPGVVGTEEMFDGAMSLRVTGHEFKTGPKVAEAFQSLRDDWCLPDGHPIESPADLWRHARELIQGLFYIWDPPPPREWLMLRKAWSAACRQILRDFPSVDPRTPLGAMRLVENGSASWALETLENWRAIKDIYTPNTVATWIDDSCIEWVEQWASKNEGVIWCWETKFAERLADRTGLPYYGRQGLCGKRMIEDERSTCIASIKANYKGRNLQQFNKNLIVSIPPGGEMFEQLLGRTHRDFQEADEVTCDLLLGCYEQWDVFRQARRDAEYVERTMRQAQKLNFADIEVQDEIEIARRHAKGDPLWNKSNASFFESDDLL